VEKYRQLIGITEEVVNSARKVLQQTRRARGKDVLSDLAIGELRKEIDHYGELGNRVIDQACRRVLQGEQVPTAEKIYSLFETHTDLIKRGKVLTPVEFGHKVFLAESAQGLITQYAVLQGNPVSCCAHGHMTAVLVKHWSQRSEGHLLLRLSVILSVLCTEAVAHPRCEGVPLTGSSFAHHRNHRGKVISGDVEQEYT
jgi:hypothetical protein